MAKRIVLYEPSSGRPQAFSKFPMPRLGTILLGTILRDVGHDVSVYVDSVYPPPPDVLGKADLVGISTITVTAQRAYMTAHCLRAAGIPVVLGGPHVTFMTDEALCHADYVFRGEAENSIVPLVEAIFSGRGLRDIPGLSYRRNGEVFHNPSAEPVANLDTLPNPDFSLIVSRKNKTLPSFVVPIQTSRGCPFDCSFCSVTEMFGREYRYRSTERVLDELTATLSLLAPWDWRRRRVFFYDDHLAGNRERLREMLDGILQRNLRFGWAAQVRTDIARDEELLSLMKRAGCRTLYLGIESVNPETLKEYRKGQTADEIEANLKIIRKHGIRAYGMFVLGSDSDTVETVRATANFALQAAVNTAQFLVLTPLPGTRCYKKFEEEDRLLHNDWSRYDTHNVTFRPAQIPADILQEEIVRSVRRFYSLPRIAADFLRFRWNDGFDKVFNRRIHGQAARSWLHESKKQPLESYLRPEG